MEFNSQTSAVAKSGRTLTGRRSLRATVCLLGMHEGEYISDSLSGCAVNKKAKKKEFSTLTLGVAWSGRPHTVRRSLRATFCFACYAWIRMHLRQSFYATYSRRGLLIGRARYVISFPKFYVVVGPCGSARKSFQLMSLGKKSLWIIFIS